MDQKLLEKLMTPEGFNEILAMDFSKRRALDPKAIEAFIQIRLQDQMDASLDIARATMLLAKNQVDRFRVQEVAHRKSEEPSALYADLVIRPNGYSWVASWRTGGYICNRDGKYVPYRKRLTTKADDNYHRYDLHIGPAWAQELALDCEGDLAQLRTFTKLNTKVREALYRLSTAVENYFNTQTGCIGFEYRAKALKQADMEARFAKRYGLKK